MPLLRFFSVVVLSVLTGSYVSRKLDLPLFRSLSGKENFASFAIWYVKVFFKSIYGYSRSYFQKPAVVPEREDAKLIKVMRTRPPFLAYFNMLLLRESVKESPETRRKVKKLAKRGIRWEVIGLD